MESSPRSQNPFSGPFPPGTISPVSSSGTSSRWNLFLFLGTVITTTLAGAFMEVTPPAGAAFGDLLRSVLRPAGILQGMPFSFSLLLILGSHEMGHYLACRYYRVNATLPYFIPMLPFPFPPFLGTVGAFIRIRGQIPTRNALFDIGAAGPLVGFLFTIPVLYIGLLQSEVLLLADHPTGIYLGEPLLCRWMAAPFLRGLPDGATLQFGSVALAGWIGLLATSLNLLPVGQLDGGHICYSVSRRFHARASRVTAVVFLLFALLWQSYLLWAILLFVLGRRHPALRDENRSLSPGRIVLTWVSFAILALSFIPNPIRIF